MAQSLAIVVPPSQHDHRLPSRLSSFIRKSTGTRAPRLFLSSAMSSTTTAPPPWSSSAAPPPPSTSPPFVVATDTKVRATSYGALTTRESNSRSDGVQPHLVNIQFQKKVQLQLANNTYTPSKISIRAGDGFHNLKLRA